jgi:hypothetical protein
MAGEEIGRAGDQRGFWREETETLYFLTIFTPREGSTQI